MISEKKFKRKKDLNRLYGLLTIIALVFLPFKDTFVKAIVFFILFTFCFPVLFFKLGDIITSRCMPLKPAHFFKMNNLFFRRFQIFCEPLSKRNKIFYCKEKDFFVGVINVFNDKNKVIVIYAPQKKNGFSRKNIKKLIDFYRMNVEYHCSNDLGTLLILSRTRKSILCRLESVYHSDYYNQQKLFYEFMDDSIGNFSNSDKIS
ncbi:MAG: hypothetical protein IKV03_05110 [Alphaproteobacteria bacterium]|nr:hypothetical protein [Alphaproteobacteria bacterium]